MNEKYESDFSNESEGWDPSHLPGNMNIKPDMEKSVIFGTATCEDVNSMIATIIKMSSVPLEKNQWYKFQLMFQAPDDCAYAQDISLTIDKEKNKGGECYAGRKQT